MNPKKIVILFFSVFSLNSQADSIDGNTCPTTFPPLDPHVHGTCSTREVDGWTATTEQIKRMNCPPEIPSAQQMYQYVEDRFPSPGNNKTTTIKGIDFEDENPELLKHFEDLITKRTFIFDSEMPEDKQDNIQSIYEINPSCKKVKCAIQKMFGAQAARTLFLKTKYGLNISNHAWQLSSRPTNKEMNDLFLGALTMPDHLLPMDGNKRYTRFSRNSGAVFGDRVLANATISFFDFWETFPSEHRQYAAFHELAHYTAGELDLDENDEWLKLSGWVQFGDEWEPQFPNTFPSQYGATNPHEDFAEAMSAYRYNPSLLLEMSPEKYDYLRENVFLGIEYSSTDLCNKKPPIITHAIEQIKTRPPKKSDMKSILDMCAKPTAEYILGKTNAPDAYHKCLIDSAKKYELVMALTNLYPTNKVLQTAVLDMPMHNFRQELNNITPSVDINDLLRYTKKEMINSIMKEVEEVQGNYFYLNDELRKDACNSVALSFRLYSFRDQDSDKEQKLHKQIFRNSDDDQDHKLKEFTTYCNEIGINEMTRDHVISFFDYFESITPQMKKLTQSKLKILTKERIELIRNYNALPTTQKITSYPQHKRELEIYDNKIEELHRRLRGIL